MSSGGSVNEPLRTANSTVTIGTLASGKTITSKPFGRTLLTNGTSEVCLVVVLGGAACVAFAVCAKLTEVRVDKTSSKLKRFFFTLDRLQKGNLTVVFTPLSA